MGGSASREGFLGGNDALFREIIDTLPNPCCIIGPEGRYLYANNSIAKYLGCRPADFTGKSPQDLFPPEIAARFESLHQRVSETGERIRITEELHGSGTGKAGIVELRFDRIGVDGGHYVRVIVTDITETNARLREQTRRVELLNESIDSMAQGLIVFNPETIEFVSSQANELLEVGQDHLAAGKSSEAYFRFLHQRGDLGSGPQGERNLANALRRLHNGGQKTQERNTPSGRMIQLNTQPRLAGGKQAGGIIVTITDITRVSELALELEAARKRFKAFAEANADYFWEMDQDLRISYLSPAFTELTGIPCSAIVGMPRNIVSFEVSDPSDIENYREAVTQRKPFRDFVYRINKPSGEEMWISVSGTPNIDSHGLFLGYVGSGRDVTEHVNHRRELEQARHEAQLADRAKSEFLANMSHEIRTPMNGVMGMAELLAKTNLDAKQKTFTDIIVKSGSSLLTIINDILDFSKIDAGQMELDPAPFNLAEAVEDVATLVSSRVAEKDLEMSVRIDPKLPETLVGDAGRLRQIITNLVGNAVKFTERGQVYVNVSCTPCGGGKANIRVEVRDTGIGIPPDKQARVFEKFSQVDTSSSRSHEGTGLGLAIAHSLVALMGGEMGLESEVGKGSTFWFEVPLPAPSISKTRRKAPMDVSGSRIVIVDDNPVNREILIEQMQAWRFDCAAAENGEEALFLMRAATGRGIDIHCVVLDYQMPTMNGADVVREMRMDPALAGIPVIMLTSVDQTEEGRHFSSLGVQAHLVKPARSSLLLETLISVLSAQAPEEQAEATAAGMAGEPAAVATAGTGQGVAAPEPVIAKSEAAGASEEPLAGKDDNHVDILVCEDNEVNRIVFSQVLKNLPYSFEMAENGRIGVEKYKLLKPKLILMDVSMPEMNGLEATETIRTIEVKTGASTPIIGVTAHAIKGDREKCLSAGMDDYLSKPVSPNALEAKVRNWLEGHEASQRMQ
jgi:PAS domain S-box-containing protein